MVEHGVMVVLTVLVFSTLFVAVIENELSACRLCVTTNVRNCRMEYVFVLILTLF